MPMGVRHERGVVVLGDVARLMDDPRHFDSTRVVDGLLDDGHRGFVLDLRAVGPLGPSGLGLLTTITRRVRQAGGELVLAGVRRGLADYLDEMRMDTYWETFETVREAIAFHDRGSDRPDDSTDDG